MSEIIAVALGLHTTVLVSVSLFASRRVHDADDYLVAGRRLGLTLSTATLLATWFGAGSVLTASEEVRHDGISRAWLDPLGAGVCLIVAGVLLAKPLRRMEIDTLGDFFRVRFGPRAEIAASLILSPTYFGWIAAQFVALGGVLSVVLGVELWLCMTGIAALGLFTALLGGMWSVTLTDGIQLLILVAGLVALLVGTVSTLSLDVSTSALIETSAFVETSALSAWLERLPDRHLTLFPDDQSRVVLIGVFAAGALGNLPGQDLFQRVFSAKNDRVAQRACLLAGALYLLLGAIPVFIGLAGRALLDDGDAHVITALGTRVLSAPLFVVLIVALFSAVISTVNSAILSPAALLSRNVFDRLLPGRLTPLVSLRLFTVVVTLASLTLAYVGESAYALLEDAYELPLAGLLVPLMAGALVRRRHAHVNQERRALSSMIVGTGVYVIHYVCGWDRFIPPLLTALNIDTEFPVGLAACGCSLIAYVFSKNEKAV